MMQDMTIPMRQAVSSDFDNTTDMDTKIAMTELLNDELDRLVDVFGQIALAEDADYQAEVSNLQTARNMPCSNVSTKFNVFVTCSIIVEQAGHPEMSNLPEIREQINMAQE